MTNDVSAATGGASIAASTGSDGAQTVGASATTIAPPAAALNLAMQVGDCLLSAGMSANDVVVAMLGSMQIWLRSGSQARWACWAGRVMRR